jgi:hypothetical protein
MNRVGVHLPSPTQKSTERVMLKASTTSPAELEELDRFYREGGLHAMASPHVHYDQPACPHQGCGHGMEWIDFKLELHGDPEGIYKPLVRAWWEGRGFVGRCPNCHGWLRFTTLEMQALDDDQASQFLHLPTNWSAIAQFA